MKMNSSSKLMRVAGFLLGKDGGFSGQWRSVGRRRDFLGICMQTLHPSLLHFVHSLREVFQRRYIMRKR